MDDKAPGDVAFPEALAALAVGANSLAAAAEADPVAASHEAAPVALHLEL